MNFETKEPALPISFIPSRGRGTGRNASILKKLMGGKKCTCLYCGREVFYLKHPYATVEHLISKKNGGKDSFKNYGISCLECNRVKHSMDNHEFLFYIGHIYNHNKERIDKMTRNITNNPEDRKDMTEEQRKAYLYGAQMAAEYSKEIGKTDLATMTPDEILILSECMCKNYHNKIIELENISNFC